MRRQRKALRSAAAKKGWETRRRAQTVVGFASGQWEEVNIGGAVAATRPVTVVSPVLYGILVKGGVPASDLHVSQPLPSIDPQPLGLAAVVRAWWQRATGWLR